MINLTSERFAIYRAWRSRNLEGGPGNDVSVLSEARLSPDMSGVQRAAGERLKKQEDKLAF